MRTVFQKATVWIGLVGTWIGTAAGLAAVRVQVPKWFVLSVNADSTILDTRYAFNNMRNELADSCRSWKGAQHHLRCHQMTKNSIFNLANQYGRALSLRSRNYL